MVHEKLDEKSISSIDDLATLMPEPEEWKMENGKWKIKSSSSFSTFRFPFSVPIRL
jgi:hypothetical protein